MTQATTAMKPQPEVKPAISRSTPTFVLRLEALVIAVGSIVVFGATGGDWGLYFAVWLAPDLAMLGYIGGARIGSICYNTTHNLMLPIGLMALGFYSKDPLTLQLGLVWVSHVAIDRVLGYGLKYEDGFHHTHFTRT